jgi:hypothetical protein
MAAETDLPELMTPPEVAAYLRITVAALSQDRYLGKGVPFIRYGGKRIRYLRQDVLDYLAANRATRTDDVRGTA